LLFSSIVCSGDIGSNIVGIVLFWLKRKLLCDDGDPIGGMLVLLMCQYCVDGIILMCIEHVDDDVVIDDIDDIIDLIVDAITWWWWAIVLLTWYCMTSSIKCNDLCSNMIPDYIMVYSSEIDIPSIWNEVIRSEEMKHLNEKHIIILNEVLLLMKRKWQRNDIVLCNAKYDFQTLFWLCEIIVWSIEVWHWSIVL